MNTPIRRARSEDAEEISALVLGLSHYFLEDPGSSEVAPFLDTLSPDATRERLRSEEYDNFVAEDERGICGFIAMRNKTHLYHLFVQARVHGHGLARTLWEFVLAKFPTDVYTVNSSMYALPVYKKLGFVAIKEPQHADGLVFVPMEYKSDTRPMAQ